MGDSGHRDEPLGSVSFSAKRRPHLCSCHPGRDLGRVEMEPSCPRGRLRSPDLADGPGLRVTEVCQHVRAFGTHWL